MEVLNPQVYLRLPLLCVEVLIRAEVLKVTFIFFKMPSPFYLALLFQYLKHHFTNLFSVAISVFKTRLSKHYYVAT